MAGLTTNRKLNSRIILSIWALCCFLIVFKLFLLQVFSAPYYRKASMDNSVRIVPIKASRGIIVDRYGEIIVQNRPSYSVYLVPHDVLDIDEAAAKLTGMLDMDIGYLKGIISAGWKGRFQPIRLKRDVDFKTVSALEEHSLDIPGIVFQAEPTRLYPDSGFGSHIYGYVGEISEKELKGRTDCAKGDIVGKKGLEKYYDAYLRGRNGLMYLEVTAQGRVLGKYPDKEDSPPIKGATLVLNIDWELQKFAERILSQEGNGAIVVLDVNTGGVLTLASSPSFDANLFSGVVSPIKWSEIMADTTFPLLNRAIQGIYPPGSTMKIFTSAMALYFDKVDQEKQFDPCRGQKRFGNRIFKCWKVGGHGRLTLYEAIVQSCDIYFYQLGLACGMELWEQFMPKCRFGQLTGIDLPGEKAGISPSKKYFNERYGVGGWTKYLINNLAIGQGEILVTPLQMAYLYAAIANGGIIYKPQIVREIKSVDVGDIVIEPRQVGRLPLSDQQRQFLISALTGVVDETSGTARGVKIPGITVGGKTGTAQNPHGEDHSWFVCFAPVEKTEISIAVLVENAGHGSSVAAPLAKKLIEFYFKGKTKQIS
ncbi:MAG: penicillin-binding protein 2 [candidate division Zixibacteria bacterium 4484_95]|nr:MAG: penicillin-binding protein 2 [candidate division Zixibacteria bacterium 4484_95]